MAFQTKKRTFAGDKRTYTFSSITCSNSETEETFMKRLADILVLFFITFFAAPPVAADLLKGTPIGAPSVDYGNGGTISTTVNGPADAFDGDYTTFYASYARSFGWVGLDLGEKYIINNILFVPRANWASRLVLGIFEGANTPDFSDAIPLRIIEQTPREGRYNSVAVSCSRGFRYVRYVGPHDARCNIADIRFYGRKGEGNDSALYQLTQIPTVVIHTTDTATDIDSKTVYRPGYISFISDGGKKIYSDTLEIRGRGNGSWTFNKKPYKLKLAHKKRILGMPAKAKKWTLINNWSDKPMIRNNVAFEASRLLRMPYTPACELVDVIYNGEYKGTYQLCDQIEVKKNRVEVTEMTAEDNEAPNITGGYLIEIDAYAGSEPKNFKSATLGTPVTIHYPDAEDITPQQESFIEKWYNTMESRLMMKNYDNPTIGYRNYLDVDTYLRRLLVSEFAANNDGYYSVYMTKERNDRQFKAGPVWDFDLAFENDSRIYPVNDMTDFVCMSDKSSTVNGMHTFLKRVIDNNTEKLKQLWSEARNDNDLTPEHFDHYIDSLATLIDGSQKLNYMRWPGLTEKIRYNIEARPSYQAEIDFLKDFIHRRIAWLDNKVGLYPAGLNTVASGATGSINGGRSEAHIEGFAEGSNYRILRIDGTTAAEGVMGAGSNKVALPCGIYIVKVKDQFGHVSQKKILVN